MIDVGAGLADDIKEFSHKAKMVSDSFKQNVNVSGCMDLILGQY